MGPTKQQLGIVFVGRALLLENQEVVGQKQSVQCEGHILLVDDNTELLDVLTQVLQKSGYRVTAVQDGAGALDVLKADLPDIIVSDVMMNQVGGHELYEQVASDDDWCKIPFVFLTALSDPSEVLQAKASGCDDYLVKPFDPAELLSVIKGKMTVAKRRQSLSGEQIDRYRKRIVHTLSHEFRTPLVAINTGAELLMDQHRNLDETRFENLLASIYRGGRRLQRLVDDFMTLQQIDSGAAEATCERLRREQSFEKLVRSSLEIYEENNPDEPLNYDVLDGRVEGKVNIYDMQVIDAIQRILSNAYKFASGQPLTVSFHQGDTWVAARFRDRGPGLPEGVMNNARELFTQIEREKFEQQGCGLGLSISAYFVELNGGLLCFRTPQDGVGLELELRFPTHK